MNPFEALDSEETKLFKPKDEETESMPLNEEDIIDEDVILEEDDDFNDVADLEFDD